MTRPYGEIVTFYSYKGGTGRSMVLANVGHLLTASGSYGSPRVLLIDWDLEAPGLERFFGMKPSAGRSGPGLIDYLTDMAALYQGQAPKGELPERMARDQRAVQIFKQGTVRYPLKKYYVSAVGGRRNLCLMHAGRSLSEPGGQDAYWEKVRSFDWEKFYHGHGSFFTHFRELLMADFDYVLIDSRTGLTDIGGICTRVMPQKLVLVFAPNHQNIDGVLDVAEKSINYRMASRDPRSLTVFPLASRIDGQNSQLRTTWWLGGEERGERIRGYQPIFEEFLSKAYRLDRCELSEYFDATQIPHDSSYAYGEAIAAAIDGTNDRLSIGYACEQLTRRLVQLSGPWEPLDQRTGVQTGTVFINYRRADSAAAAARLYDGLAERLGQQRVFLDVGSVGVGQAWSTAFAAYLETATAVIVLIGRSWLVSSPGAEAAPQETGDFVNEEIAAALRRDIPVIPVLLDGAAMPARSQLPSDIQALTDRNAFVLDSSRWQRDVDRLATALESVTGPAQPASPFPDAERAEPKQAVTASIWARMGAWFRKMSGTSGSPPR
jgi:MinD-like ATPase involved in chromosome partitioning or flagellar assembly